MENVAGIAAKLQGSEHFKKVLDLGRVAQDYAAQQGVQLPSLGKERTMNDDMPGAFGRTQSSGGGLNGIFEKASSVLNGGSADGFGGNRGFGGGNGFGAAAAAAATAAGFGGAAHAAGGRGEQQRQRSFGRSNSFNDSRGNNFSQQQQQQQAAGFGQPGFAPTTPQGFGPTAPVGFGTPGTFGPPTPQLTPSFSQQGAPAGFNNQAYPPAYSVMDPPFGFSGAMTTQGQPGWGGSQHGWGGGPQQQYDSRGFAKDMQPGFGANGGGGWGSAATMAAGGLAAAGLGAGLASTYNQAFGSGSGGNGGPYGFPTGIQQGYTNPAVAYGGPPGPPNGQKSKKKGGGGGKKGDKSAVVTEQPPMGPVPVDGWLSMPQGYELPEGIPKGLEILAMVDGLMVHQEVETLEAIANAVGIGYEGNNQYKISNRAGVHVYQAVEETGFCWRCCCTQLRPVHMKIFDQTGTQVLSFQRHFRLFPCAWFEPCRENITVFHGAKDDGKVIGRVTQSCCGGCCTPKLNILSRKGERDLMVKGPCVIGDMCGTKFDVLTDSKRSVGEVRKLAPNSVTDLLKEVTTDADKFTITFPQDLKVETKATALVSLLLVDLLFFEFGGNTQSNLDGTCSVDLCVMFCCGCPFPCRVSINSPDIGKKDKGAPVADEITR